MPLYGVDVSDYQPNFDFATARNEGFDFAFIKATEGDYYINADFGAQLARAQAAGFLVAAYHFQISTVSIDAQVAQVTKVVPVSVPVALDIESYTGPTGLVESGGPEVSLPLVAALRAAGYTVALTYMPQWYWINRGSPDLTGLPPLWTSRYPDNAGGFASDAYQRAGGDHGAGWTGYGGLHAAVYQFTSTAVVAGNAQTDCSAYLGTRDELAALLSAASPGGTMETDSFTPAAMKQLADFLAAEVYDKGGSPAALINANTWVEGGQMLSVAQQVVRQGVMVGGSETTPIYATLGDVVKALHQGLTPAAPTTLTDAQVQTIVDGVFAKLLAQFGLAPKP